MFYTSSFIKLVNYLFFSLICYFITWLSEHCIELCALRMCYKVIMGLGSKTFSLEKGPVFDQPRQSSWIL